MHNHLRNTFYMVWISQTLVILAVVVVVFTAGILTYQQTDSLSSFALIVVCGYLPELVVLPLAGVLVDRYPRRWLLIGCSLAQACTFSLGLWLVLQPAVSLHGMYLLLIVISMIGGLHRLTCNASISLFTRDQAAYPRMNGLVQAGLAAAHILGPLLAGLLLEYSEGWVVMAVAVAVCVLAALLLLAVNYPQAQESVPRRDCRNLRLAIAHVRSVPGLTSFMLLHAFVNLARGSTIVMFTPFVLSFASEAVLGSLRATAGVGMACGAFLISLWRWPAQALRGVLLALGCCGLCIGLIGLLRTPLLVGLFTLLLFAATPILAALAHSIWQCRVPSELQGRVFGLRDLVAGGAQTLGYLLSPWVATVWFVPMAGSRGAGIGELFMLLGSFTLLLALLAVRSPAIRSLGDVPQETGIVAGLLR